MKSLKVTIVILALVSAVLFYAKYYIYQNIKEINQNVSVLENGLSSSDERRAYQIATKKNIANLEPEITKINNSIIANGEDVKFIEDLEALANSNGLSIDISSLSFEDDPKISSSTITTFVIKAKAKGGWAGNYTFLAEMESLPFKVKINRFALSNIGLDSGAIGWQSDFEMRVLKYK